MKWEALKVGELAKRTGLTVRTLHHYDEIGLLKPSLRTEAGYRLYTAGDVARLQQVLSLRQLGFALEEARECLDRPDFSPLELIRLHVARLRKQVEMQQKLCDRFEAIAAHLQAAEEVSAVELLQTIAAMNMIEKYFTTEQLAQLELRRNKLGQQRLKQAPQLWADLLTAVKAEMDAGTDPAEAKVQELAQRWQALLGEFTGGDPRVLNSLRNLYANEEQVMGMDVSAMRPLMEYIEKALGASRGKHPGP